MAEITVENLFLSIDGVLGRDSSIDSNCIIRAAFTFALLDSASHPRDE